MMSRAGTDSNAAPNVPQTAFFRVPELREWLEWLAGSSNAKSASMGRWYLRALEDVTPLGY